MAEKQNTTPGDEQPPVEDVEAEVDAETPEPKAPEASAEEAEAANDAVEAAQEADEPVEALVPERRR